MKMLKLDFRSLAFFLLLIKAPEARAIEAKTTVNIPLRTSVISVNAQQIDVADASWILEAVSERLFKLDHGFKVSPVAAEDYTWSSDNKILKVKIRQRHFSDGSVLDASAVVESLKRCVKDAGANGAYSLTQIEGAENFISGKSDKISGLYAKTAHELEIRTKVISPLLLDDLASYPCSIVKPSPSGNLDFLKGAIGTGPYRVLTASPASVSLELNLPRLESQLILPKKVNFTLDPNWGEFSLLKDRFDLIVAAEPPHSDADFNQQEFNQIGLMQLIFNFRSKALKKSGLTALLRSSFQIDGFCSSLGWDRSRLQGGFIPFGIEGWTAKKNSDFHLDKLRLRFKQFGYTESQPLRLRIAISKSKLGAVEQVQWESTAFQGLPVKVQTVQMTFSEIKVAMLEGRIEAYRATKYPGSIDAHRVINSFLPNSPMNLGAFSKAACTTLINKALKEPAYDKRISLYQRADECVTTEGAGIPLLGLPQSYVSLRKPWRLPTGVSSFSLRPHQITSWVFDER